MERLSPLTRSKSITRKKSSPRLSSSSKKRVAKPKSKEMLPTEKRDCDGESHANHGNLIRNTIIGFADGLTVPFALTAGLSSLGSSKLVVLAGLAELFSGAISMGLGAYLAAVTDAKHYEVEEARERREVKEYPLAEEEAIYDILTKYGVTREECKPVVDGLKANEDNWVQFMMDFELKLERPGAWQSMIDGGVMGFSYFIGGLLPMIPYFAIKDVTHALFVSIAITVVILLVFGYFKAIVTGTTRKDAVLSGLQTLVVGAMAAGVSYGIVRGVNTSQNL